MKQFTLLFVLIAATLTMSAQYIYNDFDGNQNEPFSGWPNVPTVVTNPDQTGINTSAGAAEFVRSDWAQWDHVYTELSGRIDFSTGNIFSVKVHSPIACDVLFKLEDKTNGGIFTERLLSITTPNQWVQLDFDFTGEASDTYDKIVIFFDFATFNPNTFYFDDVEGPNYGTPPPPPAPIYLPVTFENPNLDYRLVDFGGNWSSVIDDPNDPDNRVVETFRDAGAQTWAGTTLGEPTGLGEPVPFTEGYTSMTLDVYSPAAGIPILLKLEVAENTSVFTEVIANTTVANAWETLTFDFGGDPNFDLANDYNKPVIFFNFGTPGGTAGEMTFYWDNLEYIYPVPEYIYNDFDDNQNDEFSGDPSVPVIVPNPDPTGMNTSANCMEYLKDGADWAFVYSDLPELISFENGTNFQLKVHSDTMCAVTMKLENRYANWIATERTQMITDTNTWVLLNFDFSGEASDRYSKIVIFFGFAETMGYTFYFDDVEGPAYNTPKLVLEEDVQDNFEDDGWSTMGDWIFQDPNMDTLQTTLDPVDPDNNVADYARSGTFEWANAQIELDHRLDLSQRNKFELQVYFPSSNDYTTMPAQASMKLQNSLYIENAWWTQTEVIMPVTVFDEWVTLIFDFESVSGITDYDKIVVQLGGEGHWVPAQFYFDNLALLGLNVESPNGGESIDQGSIFPIEWNYTWIDSDIQIELQKGDDDPELIVYDIPASDTIFNWTVMPTQEPGDDYRVIITPLDPMYPTDTSDAYFSIIEVTAIVPNFSASATDIAVGDSVMFTDNTTGSPTSWEWTFEGGTPETYSGQTPPYIVYNTPGTYDVQLEVGDGITSYTELKEDFIFVGEAPVADFTANNTLILVGETVDFTSNSTGEDLTFSWYFEGGTPETSTAENPTGIAYNEMGVFDVQLIVTNMYGTDTLLREDYIQADPVGIGTLEGESLIVWPVPASEKLNVNLASQGEYKITIVDLRGVVKMNMETSAMENTIDVSGLSTGLYLISVINEKTLETNYKKILIN